MATLCVQLLGKFCVRRDSRILLGFDVRKVQELFCYLLLHRNRPHPREVLADVLCADAPPLQAKKILRHSLWQLQVALGDQADLGDDRVLLVEPDWIQFNTAAQHWLDVGVLEHAFSIVRDIWGQQLDPLKVQKVREAIQLYHGDLLEGWYHDWCLLERERLQGIYLALLDRMMDYSEVCGEYEAGQTYGAEILRYDLAREHTHRRLMRLYYLSGNRTAALRQFERCTTALHDELGARPAKRTVELYKQISADEGFGETYTAENEHMDGELAPSTSLLDTLRSIQQVLGDVQRRLNASIEAAEAKTRT
jgi:DNA-binding SARP family transcriptional activator